MDIEGADAMRTSGSEIRRAETTRRSEVQSTRDEFRAGFAESRRHAEVLIESVRNDLRILREAVAAVSAKLDQLGR